MPRRAGTYDATVATTSRTSARDGERPRIERFDLEQQSLEQPRERAGSDQSRGDADGDETQRLAEHEANTDVAVAPRAMRTPISCVRSRTEYAITP